MTHRRYVPGVLLASIALLLVLAGPTSAQEAEDEGMSPSSVERIAKEAKPSIVVITFAGRDGKPMMA